MYAIITTGGKQYCVQEGDVIRVEKLFGKEGSAVAFSSVLCIGDEHSVKMLNSDQEAVSIEGIIQKQGYADKVKGIKHKPKKRYKVTFGHRQPLTEVKITKISK